MCEKGENLLEKNGRKRVLYSIYTILVGRRELEGWHYQIFLHQNVKTVNKDLEAWIRLPALEEGEHYTIEYLHDVLRVNQINYGIDEAQLQKIIDEEIYEQDVLVARGVPAVEGQDGFYEYKVNMNLEKNQRSCRNGSVDYWSMYSVQSVQKDQVIAIYHPAVQGTDGTGVSGKPIPAKVAREQGALRGTGFGTK